MTPWAGVLPSIYGVRERIMLELVPRQNAVWGLVRRVSVIHVARELLGRELPVRPNSPLHCSTQEFDPIRHAVEGCVEIPGNVAEVLGERRRILIEGAEDQASVVVNFLDRNQPPPLLVQNVVILLTKWHTDESPVRAVSPSVILASKDTRIAKILFTHTHRPVPACIQECLGRSVLLSHNDDGVAPHIGGQIILLIRDLRVMREK